jgi:hypothetical protein
MAEVWLHWAGLWILTPDGLGPVLHRAERIVLQTVRFVIDPVGLELTRERGKRKTHAWAIGEQVDWTPDPALAQIAWHPLDYRPRSGDDHFTIRGGGPLEGADFLEAELLNGNPIARVSGPRYGKTERRRVQQYGGRR